MLLFLFFHTFAFYLNIFFNVFIIYKGMIDQITFPLEAPGGAPACVISVASETRILTRTLASKKSDESHKARGGDRFRRNAVVSGSVSTFWGEKKLDPPAEPAPSPPSAGRVEQRHGDDR